MTLGTVGFALGATLGVVGALFAILGRIEATLSPERRTQLFRLMFPTRNPGAGAGPMSAYAVPQRSIEWLLGADPRTWRFLVRSLVLSLLVFLAFAAWTAAKLQSGDDWSTLSTVIFALDGRSILLLLVVFLMVNVVVDYLSIRQTFTLSRLVEKERNFAIYAFMSYADIALTVGIWIVGTTISAFVLFFYF